MSLFKVLIALTISIYISVTGYSQSNVFDNPIAEQRADPWIYKTKDGIYYLIATVPEYDRIVIRKASSINDLKDAVETEVWHKPKLRDRIF